MATMPCPSCTYQVSPAAAACPRCGHPFRAVKTNDGLNSWDFAGIGVCFVGIAVFLLGAATRSDVGIVIAVASFVGGLLIAGVGRIKAGR